MDRIRGGMVPVDRKLEYGFVPVEQVMKHMTDKERKEFLEKLKAAIKLHP